MDESFLLMLLVPVNFASIWLLVKRWYPFSTSSANAELCAYIRYLSGERPFTGKRRIIVTNKSLTSTLNNADMLPSKRNLVISSAALGSSIISSEMAPTPKTPGSILRTRYANALDPMISRTIGAGHGNLESRYGASLFIMLTLVRMLFRIRTGSVSAEAVSCCASHATISIGLFASRGQSWSEMSIVLLLTPDSVPPNCSSIWRRSLPAELELSSPESNHNVMAM